MNGAYFQEPAHFYWFACIKMRIFSSSCVCFCSVLSERSRITAEGSLKIPLNDPDLVKAINEGETINKFVQRKSNSATIRTKSKAASQKNTGGTEDLVTLCKKIYTHVLNEKKAGRSYL